jgi:MoaA/NifB/PqqE/SkfB family radical SAM enzyme
MNANDVIRAWGMILKGRKPTLSIEITKECPLRCPGCYAYDDHHLGGEVVLRQLTDHKGDGLVSRILALADEYRPLHLSLVGGDPLVRYREVEQVLPQLLERGIHVQLVTSAFRAMPDEWRTYRNFTLSVSIDGLQPEHDARRAPATYERILKNIANQKVTVHCTVTGQMMKRDGYLEEFLAYWSGVPQVEKVWFSLFTPQRGDSMPEILTAGERRRVVSEIHSLRGRFPKLAMPARLVDHFIHPPSSPKDCIFSQVTETISADFQTRITPCQFGGDPDCSQCGCMASMALAAVGSYKVGGLIPASSLFRASAKVGSWIYGTRGGPGPEEQRRPVAGTPLSNSGD